MTNESLDSSLQKCLFFFAKIFLIAISLGFIWLGLAMPRGDMLSIFKHGDVIWFDGGSLCVLFCSSMFFWLLIYAIVKNEAPNNQKKKKKNAKLKLYEHVENFVWFPLIISALGLLIEVLQLPIISIIMIFTSYTPCDKDDTYLKYYFVKDISICQTIAVPKWGLPDFLAFLR
ncbi:hypothetical protein CHU32_05990 [Superficieibacter electus]|uniref:Transmembrane protein n=1 Tax=Superficieibacter electus TaxID=2022662 RepID=A0A2P5GT88_9ENTR|nr:hypothetical protein [Superficieibacter electus]POP46304.1 hypothetical protein CHU33_05975 [Superficieibacter electus]POP49774.1 hypothetical protein CHU32_05990 [Superficieibacter electus]